MAGVTVKHITKRFGPVVAVNDVAFDVLDEEFLVMVGPSGCGKSTLLRIIAGLEEPTSGDIAIDGRMVTDLPPKERDVAMVFQSYALYPHMTAFDNIAFPLRMQGAARAAIERRVRETAELLELGDLLKRRPRELSGGERQRVALGRAIIREPKVFLMDEPLSNLDAKLRTQTRAEIIRLHRRLHTTVIYVTHDQVEAMTMGTRIAVLREGVLQQLDAPQNIYDYPANVFVGQFIGSPPMNIFNAAVVRDGGLHLVLGAMRLPAPAGSETLLGPLAGQSLPVGVRPEAIAVQPGSAEAALPGTAFPAEVEVVEPLGSEQIVHLRVGAALLLARTDPHLRVAAGDTVAAAIPSAALHCFDPQSQRALVHPRRPA